MDEKVIKVEPDLKLEEPKLTNYAVSVSDFNDVCRTCLSTENALKSLKELIEKHNYSEDLLNMIGVDLSIPICLPQNICVNCINDLEHIKKFADRSREIYNYLYNLAACTIKNEVSVILDESEEECNEQTESNNIVSQQLIPDQIFVPERKDEECYNEEAANCKEEDPFLSTINMNQTNREERINNLGMDKSIILSKKGKYGWNGHFYTKEKINKEGSIQFWRCENKSKGCNGRIWTSVWDGSFITEKQVHSCKYVKTQTSVTIHDVQSECDEQIKSNADINQELLPEQIFVPEGQNVLWYNEEASNYEQADPISSTSNVNVKRKTKHGKKNTKANDKEQTKAFVCNICGKAFQLNYYLTRHMMIHTGEKPFKCDVCGKCFNQKVVLKAHLHRHQHKKPKKNASCKCGGRM